MAQAEPNEQRLINTISALRGANKLNRVVNISFQSKIPEGYTIEEFTEAVKAVLAAPLVLEPDQTVTDGFVEPRAQGDTVYDWVELLEVSRSRSTR